MKHIGRMLAGFYFLGLVFSMLSLAGCILPGPWHRDHYRGHEVRIEGGIDVHHEEHHDEHRDDHHDNHHDDRH